MSTLVDEVVARAVETIQGDGGIVSKEKLCDRLGIDERTLKTMRSHGMPYLQPGGQDHVLRHRRRRGVAPAAPGMKPKLATEILLADGRSALVRRDESGRIVQRYKTPADMALAPRREKNGVKFGSSPSSSGAR